MPTYEYQCQECGHVFEAFQSISEKPLKKCSACEGSVKRLISSGGGLIFKGSGFYITDYKRKEKKKPEEKKEGGVGKESGDDSAKKKDHVEKKDSSLNKD